jgi:transposase-like protein
MVTVTILCPHCQQAEPVVKHGMTEVGTQRYRCKACKKTFSPNPQSNAVTEEKRQLILRCLEERTAIRGICRTVQCSPNTIYDTLKKRQTPSPQTNETT